MKLIPLTQGKFAMVDAADFEYLNQWKWQANNAKDTSYAMRRIYKGVNTKGESVMMHRAILNLTTHDIFCDHIDGNGLNNQRSNLRACTHSQNLRNRAPNRNASSSRFKGVGWHKQTKRWRARITFGGKRPHLGSFTSEEEAAVAYNKAALLFYGEFARLNIIE